MRAVWASCRHAGAALVRESEMPLSERRRRHWASRCPRCLALAATGGYRAHRNAQSDTTMIVFRIESAQGGVATER